jgi:hypothetical protein
MRFRIRQHAAPHADVCIYAAVEAAAATACMHTSAYVSMRAVRACIRQHAAVAAAAAAAAAEQHRRIRQHTPAYASIRQHTSACVSIAADVTCCNPRVFPSAID